MVPNKEIDYLNKCFNKFYEMNNIDPYYSNVDIKQGL